MRVGYLAVPFVACAACLQEIPPYAEDRVAVSFDEDQIGVGGDIFAADQPRLHFHTAGGSGVMHFPDQLQILPGDDLLATNPVDAGHPGSVESGLGIALFDNLLLSASVSDAAFKSQRVQITVDGAGVAQLQNSWQVNTPQLDGSSTFTLYPDGRVVRTEHVGFPNGQDNLFFTSFTVVRDRAFGSFTAFGTSGMPTGQLSAVPASGFFMSGFPILCLDGPDANVAFIWTAITRAGGLGSMPSTRIRPTPGGPSINFDWLAMNTATIIPGDFTLTTTVLPLSGTCVASRPLLESYSASAPTVAVQLASGDQTVRLGDDGAYHVMVFAGDGSIAMTPDGDMPAAGFAIALDGAGLAKRSVSASGLPAGRRILAQPHQTLDRLYVWVAAPITAGQRLTLHLGG